MESGTENGKRLLAEELERRFSRRGALRARLRRAVQVLLWLGVVQTTALGKRAVDIAGAILLGVLSLPLMAPLWLWSNARGLGLDRRPRLGRWAVPYREWQLLLPDSRLGRLAAVLHLNAVPALWNVLRGDMSLVGPRSVAPGEVSMAEHLVRRRHNVRPGLVCLWWIRRRANIAYGTEAEADAEYVDTRTVKGDLAIVLRALPAMLYGEGIASASDEVTILGMRINNLTMEETLDRLMEWVDGDTPGQLCFLNADCMNIAFHNARYREIINAAALTVADGIGLKLAGKILRRDIRQNVNGTDMFPRLCAALDGRGGSVFLLGAKPGVADAVAGWIRERHPALRIAGTRNGYFTAEEEPGVVRQIAESGAQLLLVAFGAPRQDLWLAENMPRLGVRAAMGVGGLFDFYSGRVPRAPLWMREIGMEWVFRFIQEPRRMWRRYLVGNVVFLWRVLAQRLRGG
jgi:N-acetylglucosaminyldiphosphoundecaprenol N-acetyl-beta-D-mannosaminyltransferase